ncbi:MAG: KamA family radical SAM protein [Planctomycetota bacterium]|nr:MAG: KamA family radical SAM protein [Planctomycetota bacterium]
MIQVRLSTSEVASSEPSSGPNSASSNPPGRTPGGLQGGAARPDFFPGTQAAAAGRARFFPGVTDEEWNDWKWQFRNRITTLDELYRLLPFPTEQWGKLREVLKDFRMGITPYYFSLIDPADPDDPILRQVVPLEEEFVFRAVGDEDPLGEEQYSPVPGITHRYPDRVLMVISNSCAIYCRYCTRKRIMYEDATPDVEIDAMVDYIARTPQVRDVIVSGGDPLTYSTAKLERILSKLRAVPHLEIIRIGTRVPVSLPQRIDGELVDMLAQYHPVWINVHFNHPREVTSDAARACDKLIRAGIPLNNQAVLLKGVNDSVDSMKGLVHGLMKMRVRPYYVYQCDPIRGGEHFRTPISKGLEIMEGLRGHTSGLAIPTFVVDAPGGGGKIPVAPQYLLHYDEKQGRALLRNFQGKVFEYLEPAYTRQRAGRAKVSESDLSRVGGELVSKRPGGPHAKGNGLRAGNGSRTGPELPVVGKSSWVHRGHNVRGPGCGS